MQNIKTVHVNNHDDAGKRIDKYLAENIDLSRNQIQNLIQQRKIYVNNSIIDENKYHVNDDDIISIIDNIDYETEIIPQNIPLNIIYEDDDIAAINKPTGMIVHPSPGIYKDTLVNAILYHYKEIIYDNKTRAGIVHRLDKDTSGIILVARNKISYEKLQEQFRDRYIFKVYIAILSGFIEDSYLKLNLPIARALNDRKKMTVRYDEKSKESLSYLYKVKKEYLNEKPVTVALIKPHTGRTHQIRVHTRYINHPVVSDNIYGFKEYENVMPRLGLHAYMLKFRHPTSNKNIELFAEIPDCFPELDYRSELKKIIK